MTVDMSQIDLRQLRHRCLQAERSFQPLGTVTHTRHGPYIHIDRGSDVLAVAHLDSVAVGTAFTTVEWGDHIAVFNEALDDRLGVWIILDLLPSLGIVPDILLTTGEESGLSTAQFFKSPKEYNWMFQFDRGGTDVVLYQYECDELVSMLGECGFHIGNGLFSDISYMDDLGIAGINFGCAYYENHSRDSHAILNETLDMVNMFVKFWHTWSATPLKVKWTKPRQYRHIASSSISDYAIDYELYDELLTDLMGSGIPYRYAEETAWAAATVQSRSTHYEHPDAWQMDECKVCGISYFLDELDSGVCENCEWCYHNDLAECHLCGFQFFAHELEHGMCWHCLEYKRHDDHMRRIHEQTDEEWSHHEEHS